MVKSGNKSDITYIPSPPEAITCPETMNKYIIITTVLGIHPPCLCVIPLS